MLDLSGKILEGKYRLLRRLGSGGVGTVYEAVHIVIENRVAIKVLRPEFANSETLAMRLVQEAKAASAIGHPSIIRIHDVGRTKDGLTFVVMELLSGEELAAHIKRSAPLPPEEAVAIMIDVLDALRAAHAKRIIHRDLKPENVFLTPGPRGQRWVKLLDFGIAKVIDRGLGAPRLTQVGTVVGTPYYMSPEHARGARDLDVRVDVYAAGVLLFEMLTRRVPFDGQSYNEVLARVLSDPFPRPRTLNPAIPEALEAVMLRATAKDRDARFPTAAAFMEALAPFCLDGRADPFQPPASDSDGAEPVRSAEVELVPEEAIPTIVGAVVAGARPRAVGVPTVPAAAIPRRSRPGPERAGPDAPEAIDAAEGDVDQAPASAGRPELAMAPTAQVEGIGSIPAGSPATAAGDGTPSPSIVSLRTARAGRRAALVGAAAAILAVAVGSWLAGRGPRDEEPPGVATHASETTVAAIDETAAADAPREAAPAQEPPPAREIHDTREHLDAERVAQDGSEALPPSDGEAADANVGAQDDLAALAEIAGPGDGEDVDAADDSIGAGPDRVVIFLEGLPDDAGIALDGVDVSNPLVIERSNAIRSLRVTARGFEPFVHSFSPAGDRTIEVRMRRAVRRDGGTAEPPDGGARADAGSLRDGLMVNPFMPGTP